MSATSATSANSASSASSASSEISLGRYVRLAAATVLTGVGAGVAGLFLALLLHAVQHLAYGYSLEHIISNESFLSGVSAAPRERRFAVLVVCGLVAGLGWYAVYRWGKPLVSIKRAVRADDPRMPPGSTLAHALLQIVTVALGSPLGREVAPRELGALWSGWLANYLDLSPADQRIMVACGAGAGLAAVYNVPLGGAVFVLEVLLCTFELRVVVLALVTSVLAALTARIGLGNEHQYMVPQLLPGASLAVWSVLAGPLFGVAAYGFTRLTTRARADAPKDARLILSSLVNFTVIGLLVMHFPQLAGNGKGPAGLSFDGNIGIALAAVVLVLKVAIEASSLRAGAEGGLLTPGLTNGALLAIVVGGAWNLVWPGTSAGAFAVVGAGAFLAASMQMPVTALVLMYEFTRVGHDMLVPMMLATVGSVSTFRLLTKFEPARAGAAARRRAARDAVAVASANQARQALARR